MLKKSFYILLIVTCLLAVATLPALAMAPQTYEFEVHQAPAIIADCSEYGYDFLIDQYAEGAGFGKVFLNQDGSFNRIQEHVSGYDVYTNTVTGKQIIGYWVVNELYPVEYGYIIRHGVPFHVTYPGMGNIVLDSGHFEFTYWFENGELHWTMERHNGHSNFYNGDFEKVCAALDE